MMSELCPNVAGKEARLEQYNFRMKSCSQAEFNYFLRFHDNSIMKKK